MKRNACALSRISSFPGLRSIQETQTFPESLRDRLKSRYGSLENAGRHLEELMGAEFTYTKLCEALRFLRVRYREHEAKDLLAEFCSGNSDVSISTTFPTSVLKDYLCHDSIDCITTPKSPRFRRFSSSKPTHDQALNVSSAEFTRLNSTDTTQLQLLRDMIQHAFTTGKTKVTMQDIESIHTVFPSNVSISALKSMFGQVENDSGVVTPNSFHAFFPDFSHIPSPSVSLLLSHLRSLYGSFLTAYSDLTHAKNTHLTNNFMYKLTNSLGIACSKGDFYPLERPISLQEFKTWWLNDVRRTEDVYCSEEMCSSNAISEGFLCHKHKIIIQKLGNSIWNKIKTGLKPAQKVKFMSEMQLLRGKSTLNAHFLRPFLVKYVNFPLNSPKFSENTSLSS